MSDSKFNIEDIEDRQINFNECLVVNFKPETFYWLLITLCFFLFGMIGAIYLNDFVAATGVAFVLIFFSVDTYLWYSPINSPQVIINNKGIQLKKKFFNWSEVAHINYKIINKHAALRSEYLCLELLNKKEISIYIGRTAIDSSIEIIAAYIKHYRQVVN